MGHRGQYLSLLGTGTRACLSATVGVWQCIPVDITYMDSSDSAICSAQHGVISGFRQSKSYLIPSESDNDSNLLSTPMVSVCNHESLWVGMLALSFTKLNLQI